MHCKSIVTVVDLQGCTELTADGSWRGNVFSFIYVALAYISFCIVSLRLTCCKVICSQTLCSGGEHAVKLPLSAMDQTHRHLEETPETICTANLRPASVSTQFL